MSKSIIFSVAITALGLALAGCGGKNSRPTTGVQVTGGISPLTASLTTDLPASTTTEEVVVNGTTVVIPPHSGLPAGTPLTIFPAGTALFNATPGDALTRGSLDLIITQLPSGTPTTFTNAMTGFATLTKPIAFPDGTNWRMVTGGGWTFGDVNGNAITVGQVGAEFSIRDNVCTYPITAGGILPRNGGATNRSQYMTVWTRGKFAGEKSSLTVVTPDLTVKKEVVVGSPRASDNLSSAIFQDLFGSIAIPTTGITSYTYSLLLD